MKKLLTVGLSVAFKIKSNWKKDTYWVAGKITEVRKNSYLLRAAFSTDLPYLFKEIVDVKILEH